MDCNDARRGPRHIMYGVRDTWETLDISHLAELVPYFMHTYTLATNAYLYTLSVHIRNVRQAARSYVDLHQCFFEALVTH